MNCVLQVIVILVSHDDWRWSSWFGRWCSGLYVLGSVRVMFWVGFASLTSTSCWSWLREMGCSLLVSWSWLRWRCWLASAVARVYRHCFLVEDEAWWVARSLGEWLCMLCRVIWPVCFLQAVHDVCWEGKSYINIIYIYIYFLVWFVLCRHFGTWWWLVGHVWD